MINILNPQNNIVATTIALTQHYKLPITNSTINTEIENHPDYPSLLSIADSLNKWQIPNAAYKIEANKLQELPLPFIAHLAKGGGVFALVTNVSNSSITYKTDNNDNNKKTSTVEEFTKIWDGVVLLAEPTPQSAEPNYKKAKQQETLQQLKMPLYLFTGLVLTCLVFTTSTFSFSLLTFAFLKFLGVIVTALLLWYEVDKANPFLQQICTGTAKTNCNAILNSKDAKLFGIISWSEIGFFYFAGVWLLLLFSSWLPNPSQTLPIIVLLNVLALPYTVFSVYYQWRVAKQWCRLCLSVQVLLVAEFVVSLATHQFNNISIQQVLNFPLKVGAFAFLLPIAIWYLLKMPLQKNQDAKNTQRHLMRLKFNSSIFNALLEKQKKIGVIANDLGITLGNPNGENTIVKVCNPYCGPCAKGHTKIHNLLQTNPNLKVQVLFTATNNEGDIKTPPVKHLLAIAAKGDAKLTAQAMDDWYNAPKKDYDAFAAKYPITKEKLEKQTSKIEAMSNWCDETIISFTPTYFINGYQMPEVYGLDDVGYFLS